MNHIKKKKLILNLFIGVVFLFGLFKFYTTFSLEDNYEIISDIYDIQDGYIKNISPYTDVSLFYNYFDLENCSIEVEDSLGNQIDSGYVMNGSITVLYDYNHQVLSRYVNIIIGDYVSDGIVNEDDFSELGKCLVSDCELEEYQLMSMDIDQDGEFHMNDLSLLDQAITMGYQEVSLNKGQMVLQSEEEGRLVASVKPRYGVNQNVKWVSLDENIAVIDHAGRVVGHQEGEVKIQAITMDDQFVAEATIKVDNTIQLSSYEGEGYVGGNDIMAMIKAIDYDGIACSSSNEEIASCDIQGKNLIMTPKAQGNTNITVTSTKYGSVFYKLDVYSVYLNVMPRYLCTTPNNIHYITVSGFHSGDLSFEASDMDIIKNSYMETMNGRQMLKIELGSKQGRATLKVKEANGNASNVVIVDVYKISIPQIGSVAKVGEEVSTTIAGDHFGNLSCVSQDTSKATCRIEGNQLIVSPLALGNVTIEVYNQFSYNDSLYDCGEAQFLVVIQE